jgi:hypothetical protein
MLDRTPPRMLLDIGSVLAGLGLAVVAFIIVILVCLLILRLLAVVLPSYEHELPSADAAEEPVVDEEADPAPSPEPVRDTEEPPGG